MITASLAVVLVGIAASALAAALALWQRRRLMALTISVTDAAAILLPLLIVADIFSVRHYYNIFDKRSLLYMIPGAVIGIALGALFFGYFDDNERILKIGLGVLALAFVAYQLGRSLLTGVMAKSRPSGTLGVIMGAAAGFTSTLAHAGGPPATIYLLPQKLPRDIFVGTNVIFFATINLVKLVPYSYLGLLRVGNLTTILILAPLAVVGVWLGVRLNRRFSEKWFNRLVYTLLCLTGIELVSGTSVINLFF